MPISKYVPDKIIEIMFLSLMYTSSRGAKKGKKQILPIMIMPLLKKNLYMPLRNQKKNEFLIFNIFNFYLIFILVRISSRFSSKKIYIKLT